MRSALITGATGLVGSWLAKDLVENGYNVTAIKRGSSVIPSLLKELDIDWQEADLLDPLQMEKVVEGKELVVHAGAIVSFKKSEREAMYETNMTGTEILVDLALEKGIEYFLHISSVAAVGRSLNSSLMTEESPWEDNKLTSHYSRSKYQSEKEVWRGFSEGLRGAILNPSVVLGPAGWDRSSARIIGYVWKGKKFYSGGFLNLVDVRDVSKAALIMIEKRIHAERYILSAAHFSYDKFFGRVAKCLNRSAPRFKIGKTLAWLAKWPENALTFLIGKDPLLTREMINNSFSSHEFSSGKIKNQLGFSFISVEDSIDWVCKEMLDLNVDKKALPKQ